VKQALKALQIEEPSSSAAPRNQQREEPDGARE
jgi:hypothetical protein